MFVADSDNHVIHRRHNDSGHRPYALWQQSGRVSRRTGGGQALQQGICNKRYPFGPGGKPAGGRHDNNTLRRVTMTGGVSTVAGNDEGGFTDGEGATVCFNRPNDIVVEGEDIIVVTTSCLLPTSRMESSSLFTSSDPRFVLDPRITMLVFFSSTLERPGPSSGRRGVHHGW